LDCIKLYYTVLNIDVYCLRYGSTTGITECRAVSKIDDEIFFVKTPTFRHHHGLIDENKLIFVDENFHHRRRKNTLVCGCYVGRRWTSLNWTSSVMAESTLLDSHFWTRNHLHCIRSIASGHISTRNTGMAPAVDAKSRLLLTR